MSTFPLLLSLADELDHRFDDFGLGFYPHRHYNRVNPPIQLSLPSDTEWLEERRNARSRRVSFDAASNSNAADEFDWDSDLGEKPKFEDEDWNRDNLQETETEAKDVKEIFQKCEMRKKEFKKNKTKSSDSISVKVGIPTFDSNKSIINIKNPLSSLTKKTCKNNNK